MSPSGRSPPPLSRPAGSRMHWMPAVVSALFMMSFRLECLGCLPALYRHDSGWCPKRSTNAPQRHLGGSQMRAPMRSATAMRRQSGSRSVPRAGLGRACSHAPLPSSRAASNLALAYWSPFASWVAMVWRHNGSSQHFYRVCPRVGEPQVTSPANTSKPPEGQVADPRVYVEGYMRRETHWQSTRQRRH